MAGVQYKFDVSEVLAGLGRLRERGTQLTPALNSFGEHLLISHRKRFERGEAPDGSKWAPLSQTYRESKDRNKDKVLVLRGYLMGTMRYQADDQHLVFGTNRVYAAIQQFGARKGQSGTGTYKTRGGSFQIPWGDIPARPFIGVSDQDRAVGLKIISDYLAGRGR